MNTICVLGLGYIGLPTAAMFATHGKQVIGVDTNAQVVERLRRGEIHIEEPGLEAFVQAAFAVGRLTVRMTPVEAEVFILAVPTPCDADHRPDLHYVERAAHDIVPFLRRGNLVILESTSPPGTTTNLIPILEDSGLRVGDDILLAHSPERVLPGRILTELIENDRIIGGHTPAAAAAGEELYRSFVRGQTFRTDASTAEMAKLMENTFRDVNIALANEFSRVATILGIDVNEAIGLANHHPRVNILRPGPGVGGHCIAVDPWFLAHAAPDHTSLIQAARAVNDSQPNFTAAIIAEAIAEVPSPVIALLGLAYKADVDDLRESPSLEVAAQLARQGYEIRLHDPFASTLPDGTPLEGSLAAILDGADAIAILTDHAPYRELRPDDPTLTGLRHRILIDTRNSLATSEWEPAGFTVHRLGVGIRSNPLTVTE